MLNELLVVERGARAAGIEMTQRHPDLKDARRVPTLLVRLGSEGQVVSVRPIPREVTAWTLRDGQHNSFPFIQPKLPLLVPRDGDEHRKIATNRKDARRRDAILAIAEVADFNVDGFENWPTDGLLRRLRERRAQLTGLRGTEGEALLASIERFLLACDSGRQNRLPREIAAALVAALRQASGAGWLDVAASVLLTGDGALLFDAEGEWPSMTDPGVARRVSDLLRGDGDASATRQRGRCSLSGELGDLVTDKFPQPNLPLLGQTYLFARNKDTPANVRYGRSATASMPVGTDVTIRLAAAIEALTVPGLRGVTWRAIPAEVPKQSDLLLAFVQSAPNVPVAGLLSDDDADEATPSADVTAAASVAAFEERTRRVIDAVQAHVGADFQCTPVQLMVLRKLDPANRKVLTWRTPTLGRLYAAATEWREGERGLPEWLRLPIFHKNERTPRPMSPPHVAPLGLVGFSRQLFARMGTYRQEAVGLPASEALGLFLENDRRRIHRVLRLVLRRRSALVMGAAHALHRGFIGAKDLDRREALRSVTMLGVLLYKLDREREGYMSGPAFKLGQLLAAADVVHAGYCADVRGGALPTSLLGNQVFTMAQTAPTKALATLCRRWKPYDGWAKKTSRERGRIERFRGSTSTDQQRRGWDVLTALRHAREMRSLAETLAPLLATCPVNDTFRAELLLGYLAGLPKTRKDGIDGEDPSPEPERLEE